MKMKFIISSFLILLSSTSRAVDPVELFSHELITTRKDEVWFVSSDERDVLPKGGYLFRFDLDVNNDGQMEVFVSTSLDVERNGELWSVFRRHGENEYVKIKESLFLGSDLRVKADNAVRKYSYYVSQKQGDGGGTLVTFGLMPLVSGIRKRMF